MHCGNRHLGVGECSLVQCFSKWITWTLLIPLGGLNAPIRVCDSDSVQIEPNGPIIHFYTIKGSLEDLEIEKCKKRWSRVNQRT